MMEENSEQTLKRTEFQLKNEDFPTLQSTFKSRRKNKKKSAKIVNKPNEIVNESSGTTSESSESMSEPSGIISEPSGIMSGPSGIVNKPSEIVNRTSGIRIPTTEISSMQVANPNVGFIPRPGSYFVGCLQPGPGMNIPIYPDGTVKNIPSTMMTDQYGMLGFLSAYRGMQVNPALATLAIGEDPINMGLGMNNQLIVPNPSGHGRREIHLNYGGPWAEKPNYSSQADAREGLEHDDISVLLCLQPGKAQLTLQSDSCPYCQHV
ncbi:unnamed protein product [Acanthocheilonema viteae]|uniref:Uncharacterized protein n=1 Tax=Acanthocheilonema viteae TaxID=6277 RepID=A0A498SH95_ACAVI|nr:unnamed protein product [Acanthocheilonema viteae]